MADSFDYSFPMKYDLELLLSRRISLQIFTDSKSLFDVIIQASKTSERRLMIDISATREAYEKQEIADIGLIESKYNLADCMTKIMLSNKLLETMSTGKLSHPIRQFVVRKTSNSGNANECLSFREE